MPSCKYKEEPTTELTKF